MMKIGLFIESKVINRQIVSCLFYNIIKQLILAQYTVLIILFNIEKSTLSNVPQNFLGFFNFNKTFIHLKLSIE
jgi:hypothetical protein